MNIDFEYTPSAPLLEDIKPLISVIKDDPPKYEQKPDECGLTIKNHIKNKDYHIELNQSIIDNMATEIENIKAHSLDHYKSIFINEGDILSADNIKPDNIIENKLLPFDNNNKPITSVDEYRNKIDNIDFKFLNSQYKGLNLNKLYEYSKYCRVHDPIMKEQKKLNRIKMNIKRKSLKQENKILMNIDFEYTPSAPLLEDIKPLISVIKDDPPKYEQKPDECGLTIKNHIKNKDYHIELNQSIIDNMATEIENIKAHSLDHYKSIFINEGDILSADNIKPDNIIENKLLPFDNNNKPITSVDEYRNKIDNIDFKFLNSQYKGLNLNKLYEYSKYCRVHDPIMKEQKKLNRIKMNIKRKSLKQENKILMNIDFEYTPSAPLLEDIKPLISVIKDDPPKYEQKPDECGLTIKNHIKNKDYHIELNQSIIDNMATEIENIKAHSLDHYKSIFINEGDILSADNIKPDNIIENKLLPFDNNNKPITSVDEYRNKIDNIDFKFLNSQYKGLNLNKLYEYSKYCRVHDPIMKEQKKLNRIKMNIKRKSLKQENKILMNIDFEYTPSAPLLEDIKPLISVIKDDPPKYEQKPDECGLTIKNHIKNKDYHIELNQSIIDNMATEIENIKAHSLDHYKSIFINEGDILSADNIKPDNIIENKLLPFDNNNKPITSVDEYRNKIDNIDFKFLNSQYKGLNLNKLYEYSKYCRVHDPIMKEQKKLNRIKMNIKRKSLKQENKILMNIDFEYTPSAPLLEDIKPLISVIKDDPPKYEQKPDECGLTIKNHIKNKDYHIELNQSIIDNMATEIENIKAHSLDHYKSIFINEGDILSADNIKPDNIIENKLLPFDNNNKPITSVDEYRNKIDNIDFKFLNSQYKGLNLNKLYEYSKYCRVHDPIMKEQKKLNRIKMNIKRKSLKQENKILMNIDFEYTPSAPLLEDIKPLISVIKDDPPKYEQKPDECGLTIKNHIKNKDYHIELNQSIIDNMATEIENIKAHSLDHYKSIFINEGDILSADNIKPDNIIENKLLPFDNNNKPITSVDEYRNKIDNIDFKFLNSQYKGLNLNKLYEYSKYCRVHDPIMKEQKKLNRIKMNIKRKSLKQENKILMNIDFEYTPSAPLLEDIKPLISVIKDDPPKYEQKPDECGLTIKNHIKNKDYHIELNQSIIDNMATEIENIKAHSLDHYKSIFINEGDILSADNIKPDNIIENKLLPFDNNNKPITSVDEYRNKIDNIDFKFLNSQYKGLNLNKLYEYSKYCRVHDPIMKEQKKLNRIKMNIKRKSLKQENKILMNIDFEYTPSAPLLEDIKPLISVIKDDPPKYEQKPDECGLTIKNHIKNKDYHIELNQSIIDNMATEIENIKAHSLDHYKSIFINEGDILSADNIKPDNIIENKLLPFDNNNKPITSVDEYRNKIDNIDFKFLNSQYKGLNLNKLYEYSKYCRVHDPIMKEQKKLNRIKMNIKRKSLKQENKILMNIDFEYTPSAPLLEDIKPLISVIKDDPPKYEQKPDECGLTIKNHIKNKDYHIELNQSIIDNMATEIENIKAHSLDHYKSIFINEGDILSADNIKPDNIIENKLLPFDNNNKPITSVDEYRNKIDNIDFKFLNSQYKGLNLNKLYGYCIYVTTETLIGKASVKIPIIILMKG
ncbi:hypothetical protein MFLAVUS_011517, partial [Mucor flavus]